MNTSQFKIEEEGQKLHFYKKCTFKKTSPSFISRYICSFVCVYCSTFRRYLKQHQNCVNWCRTEAHNTALSVISYSGKYQKRKEKVNVKRWWMLPHCCLEENVILILSWHLSFVVSCRQRIITVPNLSSFYLRSFLSSKDGNLYLVILGNKAEKTMYKRKRKCIKVKYCQMFCM